MWEKTEVGSGAARAGASSTFTDIRLSFQPPDRPAMKPADRFSVRVNAEVTAALASGRAVVALESTIIAHGLPYPRNLATARALEAAVRANGAVPATVAVLDGVMCAGLTDSELERVAKGGKGIAKLAKRDIPAAVAGGATGATTVSATMRIAARAGIAVFATGGIGGVHRGVEHTGDVSADIGSLAEEDVLVVCAGAKSILDIPRTLEALETAGVPVLVLAHDAFPAFYTRDSGVEAPARVESEQEAADVFAAARATGAANGVLLAVPVPPEHEADAAVIETAVQSALREAAERNITAKRVTPFLLQRVAELTAGRSLNANVHLAANNAAVAARVAVLLANKNLGGKRDLKTHAQPEAPIQVVFVGGVALDIFCTPAFGTKHVVARASNPGIVRQSVGGVAKNMAQAAHRSGSGNVMLVSAVGDDAAGEAVTTQLTQCGLGRHSEIARIRGARTATYCAIHDTSADLLVAVADMDEIFTRRKAPLVPQWLPALLPALRTARMVCLDGNLSSGDISTLITLCAEHGVATWYEPTSPAKSTRILTPGTLGKLTYMSPNTQELKTLARAITRTSSGSPISAQSAASTLLSQNGNLTILQTDGANGVTTHSRAGTTHHAAHALPGALANTSGGGDSFAGAAAAALGAGAALDAAVAQGLRAAAASLCAHGAGGGARARL